MGMPIEKGMGGMVPVPERPSEMVAAGRVFSEDGGDAP